MMMLYRLFECTNVACALYIHLCIVVFRLFDIVYWGFYKIYLQLFMLVIQYKIKQACKNHSNFGVAFSLLLSFLKIVE